MNRCSRNVDDVIGRSHVADESRHDAYSRQLQFEFENDGHYRPSCHSSPYVPEIDLYLYVHGITYGSSLSSSQIPIISG